jgi:uncharacterized damage-inducible protein DinB
MANIEARVLHDTFKKTRDLTKWYLSLLKNVAPEEELNFNGIKLNSIYWLGAHLVWAENFLIVTTTGGTAVNLPWLGHYKLGCDGTLHEGHGNFKSVLDDWKQVHENAMQHLLSITNEQMHQPNPLGLSFGADNTNRMMIMHAIRHESTHVGQLGWLCKLHGIQTV